MYFHFKLNTKETDQSVAKSLTDKNTTTEQQHDIMPTKGNRSTLLTAIRNNDVKNFHNILQTRGWPKESSWSDYELLMKALQYSRWKIVHVILDNGGRVFKPDVVEDSPLHVAISKRCSAELAAKLISLGARVDAKNDVGLSVLHYAANSGRVCGETINVLLRGHLSMTNDDIADEEGLRFSHIACAKSDVDVVEKLLDVAHLNDQVSLESSKPYAGFTALHFAVNDAKIKIAELLLKKGADISVQDASGTTPLHLALKLRSVAMIDLLLSYDNKKSNVVNKFGLSHFMVACAGSKQSVIKEYLDEARASTPLYDMIMARAEKVEDCTGYTPLHFAVDLDQLDNVRYLLEKGADCCVIAGNALSPHTLAERRRHDKIRNKLQKHCNIVKMCTANRSEEAGYGSSSAYYEMSVVNERVGEIKYLKKTLHNLKKMSARQSDT